jgi:photosystem II stability/assembly factor-like uncharacterized protein
MTFPTRKVGFGAAIDLRNDAWSLVRTRDGGRTWGPIASPCGKTAQYEVPSFTTPRVGWVLCAGQPGAGSQLKAVYRTGDGGGHWQIVMSMGWSPSGGVTPKAIPEQGYAHGIAFAGSRGWVYQGRALSYTSADAGHTWRPTSFGLRDPTEIGIESLTALSNRDAIALVRSADWKQHILFRTLDGGRTWHAVRIWRQ